MWRSQNQPRVVRGATMSKKVLLCGTALLCGLSFSAIAKYCVKLPSCEELGYIFPYKEGRRSIRCPFDTSKVLYLDYCQAYGLSSKPSDEAGAYQECVEEKADGTKINTGYYRYTRCNSGYTYQSGNCIYSCASNKDYPLNAPATYCKTPTGSQAFNGVNCYSSTCQQCEDGYDMDSAGTCWNCQADSSSIAYGLTLCGEGKVGNEKKAKASCADKTYYEECLVVETCFYNYRPDSSCSTGYRRFDVDSGEGECGNSLGMEVVTTSNSCQRQGDSNTWYEQTRLCTKSEATCAGKKRCTNDEGASGEKACECGGLKYSSGCKDNCEYNYSPDSSCPTGYRYYGLSGTTDCSNNYGSVVDTSSDSCRHTGDSRTWYKNTKSCTATGAPCAGKRQCPNDEGASGETACTCGGLKYFSKCKETCLYQYRPEPSCQGGYSYYPIPTGDERCTNGLGSEVDPTYGTCQRGSQTWYEQTRSCTKSGATCAGKKRCTYPDPSSLCSCGGYLYSDNCLTQCNYEDTPETCETKGMGFSLKCLLESGEKYGECVKS